MNIFEKLMFSRQLKFAEGDIELFGTRLVMIQSSFFSTYTLQINDSPDRVVELYQIAKKTFATDMAKSISKMYEFTFNDFFKWMTNIAMLAGWGTFKWELLDEGKKIAKINIENSPIAKPLINKVSSPVDHLIRGFIAGAASVSLKTDIDVMEEKCVALNSPYCEFVFKPSDQFEKTTESIRQIGNK